MNIGMHVLFSILGSSGHMPSNGITGSNSHFIFSFLKLSILSSKVAVSVCIPLQFSGKVWAGSALARL